MLPYEPLIAAVIVITTQQVVNDAAKPDVVVSVVEPKRPIGTKVSRGSDWVERVRRCIVARESGGDYHAQNRHSSASGAYQFLDGTWQNVTGLPGSARDYSKSVQDAAFYKLFDNGRGKSHWNYPPKQCW